MKAYLQKEWDTMSDKRKDYIRKQKRIRIENESNPKRYVNLYLPINEGELTNIFGDMLGRHLDGYVLDDQSVRWYYTKGNVEIEDIYLENELTLFFLNMEEPSCRYGNNPNVTKENGEQFKGTIDSTPRHKVLPNTL